MEETLLQVLQKINKNGNEAEQLSDMVIGTVTSASPLEVSIDTTQAILKREVLLLTANVIERRVALSNHNHKFTGLAHVHSAPGGMTSNELFGTYETESNRSSVTCYEQGVALPTNLIQRALAVGDKVLLLSVQHGQKFIILSRLYE